MAGIFAFAVLADYYPVEIAAGAGGERRCCAAEDAGWAHVGVLLEGLAEREAEAPEGEVVGYIWGFVSVSSSNFYY